MNTNASKNPARNPTVTSPDFSPSEFPSSEFTDQPPNATLNTTKGAHTMTAVTFDTLAFVKKLEAKGFKTEQAEGITDALKDAFQVTDLASKADLTNELGKIRLEVKAEIAGIRAEIAPIKWMVGVTTAGIISLVIKTFF
jgi:tRNA threonylcarbamoyladenosine modification (KEOPS) complex  Pcc1 subunit